ncbi:hypothetical protein AB5I41_24660 [Sphingomonas sp. MMS24-JH45]
MDDKGRLIYMHNGSLFLVTKPIDGEPATHTNSSTISFAIDRRQADKWHKAGVENGGTAIEDAPGVRAGGLGHPCRLCARSGTATSCARCTGCRPPPDGIIQVRVDGGHAREASAPAWTRRAGPTRTT